MDRPAARILLRACRAAGLDAWLAHAGELYVVCCRPAPGHPPLWLTSPEDAARRLPDLVRSLNETWTMKPVQPPAGSSDRSERASAGTISSRGAETGPAAKFGLETINEKCG